MDEGETGSCGEKESASPVAPAKPGDGGRQHESRADDEPRVPTVLPPNDLAPAQVADVGGAGVVARLDEHPADVGEEKTLVGVVWVEIGVSVTVVRTMFTAPPFDRALYGTRACDCEKILERLRCVVRPMRP